MTGLDHFFVLFRPGGAPLAALPRGRPWRVASVGPLLVGWQGEAAAEQGEARLLHVGDRAGLPAGLDVRRVAAGEAAEAARLDGAFAAAAFDPASGRAALVTDRFGLMPLYVCHQGDAWGYATSLAALARLLRPSCRPDPVAVAEMIVLQMPLADRTLAREVRLAAPATVIRLDGGADSPALYWDWDRLAAPAGAAGADLVGPTYDRIERAILRAVPPGVRKVALPLSGGLDSRLLAAVLARHGVPVQAYNVDFGREAAIAREVAAVLRLPLRGLPMLARPESVGEAHDAAGGAYHANQVWGWDMAAAAERDGCDVLFDGLAFDTILGAVHNTAGDRPEELAANLEANYGDLSEGTLARLMGAPAASEVFAAVRSSLAALARESIGRAGPRASDHFLMTNRIRKYTFGYCLANLNRLPASFPYVTTELFEFCQRLPLPLRQEHTLYRQLYREVFPELARIPWAKTGLPLDRYASNQPARWRLRLAAALRLLSRGRLSLSDRGGFDHAFRSRPDLREEFLRVLRTPCPDLEGVLPEALFAAAVREQLAGRDRGGLLQGLYAIKRSLARLERETASPTEVQEVQRV